MRSPAQGGQGAAGQSPALRCSEGWSPPALGRRLGGDSEPLPVPKGAPRELEQSYVLSFFLMFSFFLCLPFFFAPNNLTWLVIAKILHGMQLLHLKIKKQCFTRDFIATCWSSNKNSDFFFYFGYLKCPWMRASALEMYLKKCRLTCPLPNHSLTHYSVCKDQLTKQPKAIFEFYLYKEIRKT